MPGVPPQLHVQLAVLAAVGVVAGLALFVRGLAAYRSGVAVGGISTSTVASAAAGEIRVTGSVRPGPITLVSPVQSRTCVFYRSRVTEVVGEHRTTVLSEERAVGFIVDDGTGAMHVFPAGARWELPESFGASSGVFGDEPAGVALNAGPSSIPGDVDREAAIQALLTVHRPNADGDILGAGNGGVGLVQARRIYQETVLSADHRGRVRGPVPRPPGPVTRRCLRRPLGRPGRSRDRRRPRRRNCFRRIGE